MAYVYWIHLPEHNDIMTQGYIGVTSKSVSERIQGHIKAAKRRDRRVPVIGNVLLKYKDVICVTTLIEAEENYCYEVEKSLRPSEKIGWNITVGGKIPTRGFSGKNHTIESIKKMSDARRATWEEKLASSAVAWTNRVKPKPINLSIEFKRYRRGRRPDIWEKAGDMYLLFTESNGQLLASQIAEKFNFARKDQTVRRIVKGFAAGWDPFTDEIWLERFKNGT